MTDGRWKEEKEKERDRERERRKKKEKRSERERTEKGKRKRRIKRSALDKTWAKTSTRRGDVAAPGKHSGLQTTRRVPNSWGAEQGCCCLTQAHTAAYTLFEITFAGTLGRLAHVKLCACFNSRVILSVSQNLRISSSACQELAYKCEASA